jgi:hypothetical protein
MFWVQRTIFGPVWADALKSSAYAAVWMHLKEGTSLQYGPDGAGRGLTGAGVFPGHSAPLSTGSTKTNHVHEGAQRSLLFAHRSLFGSLWSPQVQGGAPCAPPHRQRQRLHAARPPCRALGSATMINITPSTAVPFPYISHAKFGAGQTCRPIAPGKKGWRSG